MEEKQSNEKMTVAVVIKHPYRGESDFRVDIYDVPKNAEYADIYRYVMSKMLGPFEIVAITKTVSFNCKYNPETP